MKIKSLIHIFPIVFILFNTLLYINAHAQNSSSEEQITGMLKNFYTIYITEKSVIPENKKKIDSIQGKCCTTKLLKHIKTQFRKDKLDYNPFLNAQDIDTETIKTLTIRKDSKKNNLYYVSYIWPFGKKEEVIIKLIIVKQKDGYKIDSIL